MRTLAGLLVVALAAAACSAGATVKTKPVAQPKLGPPVDEKKAKDDASGFVGEVYQTIGRGDTKDGLFTLLSDRLVVLGPRKLDSFATRADALVAIQDLIDPRQKKKTPMKSGSLNVVASPGGRSAWVFDVVATEGGDPLALTAILTNYDDLWTVETAFLARMPAHAALAAERARDGVVPPAAGMKAKMMESSNGPPLKAAVEKFQKGLLDQQLWGDDLADGEQAILVGPEAGDVARGKAIGKVWAKRMEVRTRFAATGDIAAAATVDGQLAWVSAPVTRAADGEDPLPLRAFAIFEKAGTGWKLIALHESLAIDAPGSGTAWKKIVPPKPPEPKVEVVAKVEAKKAEPPAKKTDEPKKVAKKAPVEETPKKAKKADESPKVAKKDEPPAKKKAVVDEAPKKKVKSTVSDKKPDVADETPRKKKKTDDLAVDEAPRKKKTKADELASDETPKKKKKAKTDDDVDDAPKKKKLKKAADDAADETPRKKKKADDDADEAPRKKKLKKAVDDDEAPKKKKKADDDVEETPRKKKKVDGDDTPRKKKVKTTDDDDETPKKKGRKADDDDAPRKKARKADDDDDKPRKKKADDEDRPKKSRKPADDDDDVKVSDD